MRVYSRCKIRKADSEFRIRTETRTKNKTKYINNTCKVCDSEISNKNYFKNKDNPTWIKKWREKSNDYYYKNHENCLKKQKVRRDSRQAKERRKEYDLLHSEKIKADHKKIARKWLDFQRDNITDVYCIGLIRSQNGGKEKCPIITPEMIEQKRLSIQIKRKLYVIRKKTISPGNNVRVNSVFSGISIDRGIK